MALALLALMATAAQASSWRINHNTMQNPDFADINAAMASASVADGDTLYLDPGCSLTADQTISKQVTVVGCGYFRTDLAYPFASILGKLYITAPFAKVESAILNNVYIRAENVTVQRCYALDFYLADNSAPSANANIRQCYCRCIYGKGKSDALSAYCSIENCMILADGGNDGFYAVINLYYPTIRNCYIYENCQTTGYSNIYALTNLSYYTIVNCIILNGKKSSYILNGCSNAVTNAYNITSNTDGMSRTALFLWSEGNNDERYQLNETSPARGYAADGSDIGPFAGNYPYVLGGLPMGHPYYTKAQISPRSDDDKVKVSLQIKMQDE